MSQSLAGESSPPPPPPPEMVLEKACKTALQRLEVGHAPVEHVRLFRRQILSPHKVAHTACLSVDLSTHPDRRFPSHFVDHMPSCLRVLLRITGPLCRFGYVPPGVWRYRHA